MYTNPKGETSIRFTDYKYSIQKDEVEEEVQLDNKEFMNIYVKDVDDIIQKAKIKYNKNKLIVFKYKGCKKGQINITEVEHHFRECNLRQDNYKYRFLENSEEENLDLVDLDQLDDNIYLKSCKEFMETTSTSASHSPFQRTTQTHTINTETKNVPRLRVYRTDPEYRPEQIRPIGKRRPLEEPFRLQDGGEKGKILNIAAHDPQLWNSVLDIWKGTVVADYIKTYSETNP